MRFPLLAKLAAIGMVMFLLLGVLTRIDWLVSERRARQATALHSVAQSLSAAQTLTGPLLQRHCTEEWDTIEGEGKARRTVTSKREFTLHSAPQALRVDSALVAEARYRGLFKVNGYAGKSTLQARWAQLGEMQPQAEHKEGRLRCEPATVWVGVTDPRGIRSANVTIDGAAAELRPGTGHARYERGLSAGLTAARSGQVDQALEVSVQVEVVGTARMALVPAAEQTTWALRSDWPHPSFGGRFLPTRRQIDANGFTAEWTVSALASPAAADAERGIALCEVVDRPAGGDDDPVHAAPAARSPGAAACLDTIDVSFIDPVNPYTLTDRATKYAMLFIVLTFAAVALTEVMSRRRVHPVQYALVGLALALFYLLLISLSEHIAFGQAYAVASTACVALLGYYARHMLGSWRAGAAFGAGIALLYGLLWKLLRMEQWSLAIGSVMLFAVLAAVMVLTRRIDWYALVPKPPAAHRAEMVSPT
jgi:inner membrane protein